MKSFVSPHSSQVLFSILSFLTLFIDAGVAEEMTFKSPTAIKAKLRYQQSVTVISQRFTNELDRQIKFSMQAGQLDEANQIQEAKKWAAAGEPAAVAFKAQPDCCAKSVS